MKLTPPIFKLKIENSLLPIFSNYLLQCVSQGFSGNNNYKKIQPVREDLFLFHLKSLVEQVAMLQFKNMLELPTKKVIVKFNYAERLTLSNLFKRVEVPPILTSIEYQLINQLTLTTNL